MANEKLICLKCRLPLEKSPVKLRYLGFEFVHDLPKCPHCGQVYLPEELAEGKVKQLEIELEDK